LRGVIWCIIAIGIPQAIAQKTEPCIIGAWNFAWIIGLIFQAIFKETRDSVWNKNPHWKLKGIILFPNHTTVPASVDVPKIFIIGLQGKPPPAQTLIKLSPNERFLELRKMVSISCIFYNSLWPLGCDSKWYIEKQ
jgi:hypothetical protein